MICQKCGAKSPSNMNCMFCGSPMTKKETKVKATKQPKGK